MGGVEASIGSAMAVPGENSVPGAVILTPQISAVTRMIEASHEALLKRCSRY